jgi:hypothetical protein
MDDVEALQTKVKVLETEIAILGNIIDNLERQNEEQRLELVKARKALRRNDDE